MLLGDEPGRCGVCAEPIVGPLFRCVHCPSLVACLGCEGRPAVEEVPLGHAARGGGGGGAADDGGDAAEGGGGGFVHPKEHVLIVDMPAVAEGDAEDGAGVAGDEKTGERDRARPRGVCVT